MKFVNKKLEEFNNYIKNKNVAIVQNTIGFKTKKNLNSVFILLVFN